jgi:hypothetical protein
MTMQTVLPRAWQNAFTPLENAAISLLLRHGAHLHTGFATALAMRAELLGHSFVEPSEYADQIALALEPTQEPLRWPALEDWLRNLRQCPWVADAVYPPAEGKAIVLSENGVYLRRVWCMEQELAARVLAHVTASSGILK